MPINVLIYINSEEAKITSNSPLGSRCWGIHGSHGDDRNERGQATLTREFQSVGSLLAQCPVFSTKFRPVICYPTSEHTFVIPVDSCTWLLIHLSHTTNPERHDPFSEVQKVRSAPTYEAPNPLY